MPAPDGDFEYFTSYVIGGQYPRVCRRPRGGGPESRAPRRQPRSRRPCLLAARQPSPTATTTSSWPMPSTKRDRSSSPSRSAIWRPAGDLRRRHCRHAQCHRVGPRQRRPCSTFASMPTSARSYVYRHRDRHARQRRRARLRGERSTASTLASARPSRARFVTIDAHDHQTNEAYLIDADRPESQPAPGGAARSTATNTRVEHHGERLIITTNSGGAEDFRICEAPAGGARARQLARKSRRTSAGASFSRPSPSRITWPGSSAKTVCRASSCAVSPTAAEHAIAFDEEAYSLGMSAALRVRHHDAALHLFRR